MEAIKLSEVNFDRDSLRSDLMSNFESGYNCAETIVAGFLSQLGADAGIMRLATPFGGGLGGRRDLCGLITGGSIIIGLLFGRDDPRDIDEKTVAYKLVGQYYRWFKTKKQILCSEIVPGRFTGHTRVCVDLLDGAHGELVDIIMAGRDGLTMKGDAIIG